MGWSDLWSRKPLPAPSRPPSAAEQRLALVRAYHRATKHQRHRFADGPGYLDWANQPDPFRRYAGAPLLALALPAERGDAAYDAVQRGLARASARPSAELVAELCYDSFALSAWKQAGDARWALRVNPSSGNLHPTELYFACGPEWSLAAAPALWHYAPREHGLERLARYAPAAWANVTAELPAGSVLVACTSIGWREAWKYGERSWRYCQHDLGHALAALGCAAAAQGWRLHALPPRAHTELDAWLGLARTHSPERERADLVCVLVPGDSTCRAFDLAASLDSLVPVEACGVPNELSAEPVEWPAVEAVAEAVREPAAAIAPSALPAAASAAAPAEAPAAASASASTPASAAAAAAAPARSAPPSSTAPAELDPGLAASALSWREIARRRRSAVDMDARTSLSLRGFVRVLSATLPRADHPAYAALDSATRAHLVLFVHRVDGLAPGLYFLARHAGAAAALRPLCRAEFAWTRSAACAELELYSLYAGDVRGLAASVSCDQGIAGNGALSLGMLCEYGAALDAGGAAAYPRLYWECGALGQVLYLEAEAQGLRATGIGCFYDDAVHATLGLAGEAWQSLYHFAVGAAIDDPRLSTLAAYPAPAET
jgi:nitroreductase